MVCSDGFAGVVLPVLDFAGSEFQPPRAFACRHVRIELGLEGNADLAHGPARTFFSEAAGSLA